MSGPPPVSRAAIDPVAKWLVDLAMLQRLLQAYARAVDDRDVEVLATLFHPDGTIEGVRGSSSVTDYLEAFTLPRGFPRSMHALGAPLIDLDVGSDRGRLDTYGVVHQLRAPDDTEGDLELGVRYQDDVVWLEDRWVVSRRKATIVWVHQTSRTMGDPLGKGAGYDRR